MGPIFEDPAALLSVAGEPVIAVGDMVTYHLVEAGRPPDVAFVDERSERAAIDNGVRKAIVGNGDSWFDRRFDVANPSATLTASLLEALVAALDGGPPTIVNVYGEEDLAALPAIVAAPDGASVVYGQPGEGMVHVEVETAVRERCRSLLERMHGDPSRALAILAN
ncbi:GTP-dependent dephospho-CoA kinase family protein [Halorhabdus salina]|uniref:GTP-dependent dephospho-CoA kinase family protein n=1 Tax=Halorhabdus salina TaxID=2750670 RepID=UPI0015EEB7D8|nr:GTP-dependent dephospho-CoA kinase family protein [Halorhabdus salina]